MNVANALPLHKAASSKDETSRLLQREEVAELLKRYPDIDDREVRQILNFLSNGMHLDVGLIAGADEFRAKVAEIREKHSDHFRLRASEIGLFLLITAGPVALLFWHYLA